MVDREGLPAVGNALLPRGVAALVPQGLPAVGNAHLPRGVAALEPQGLPAVGDAHLPSCMAAHVPLIRTVLGTVAVRHALYMQHVAISIPPARAMRSAGCQRRGSITASFG